MIRTKIKAIKALLEHASRSRSVYEVLRASVLSRFKNAVFFILLGFAPLFGQKINIQPDVRMLALGASYTIGEGVQESERWPHQFMDALISRGVTGQDPDYIARTGWTTGNLLYGIENNLDRGKYYNLVSILIGVNNQYQGLSIDIYEPDLKEIIDIAIGTVQGDRSKVFILSIPDYAYTPFGRGNASISEQIDSYNRIKQRVAIDYGIVYIDITEISREGLNDPSLVASDGLHPSELQYEKWVETISRYLQFITPLSNEDPGLSSVTEIKIYPNPLSSVAYIDAADELSYLRVISASGALVHEQIPARMPVQIDLSKLAPGMYSLVALNANQQQVVNKKIIIR